MALHLKMQNSLTSSSNQTEQTYASINIIGAGCIAHLLALTLTNNSIIQQDRIRLYSRRPKKNKVIKYQSKNLGYEQNFAYFTLSGWQPADLIIICVKTPQLSELCAQLSALEDNLFSNRSTPILLMMNGMGLLEELSTHFPKHPLLHAITTHGAKFEHNNLIHSGRGITKIGGLKHDMLKFHQDKICRLLGKAIPQIKPCEDIFIELWKKLFVNAIINPITTIHKIKNGEIINSAEINQLVKNLCEELIPLQIVIGISRSEFNLYQAVSTIADSTKNNISSMYQDHLKERQSEIEAITGYLLKKAALHQFQMPLHKKIYSEIKRLENQF